MDQWKPTLADSPFDRIGGAEVVRAIAGRFYDLMERDEPTLAKLHPHVDGRVLPENRERFALFLIGWLGGPQEFIAKHGHPQLRMRHARVPVDTAMRDAWMRTMVKAFDELQVQEPPRSYVLEKLAGVADFMRNMPG